MKKELTETKLMKALTLIAFGLQEKRECKINTSYPYSPKLQQGINMLAALAIKTDSISEDKVTPYLSSLNESSFLASYAAQPVSSWFRFWDEQAKSTIQSMNLWHFGPLIYIDVKSSSYALSNECVDFINDSERDLLPSLEEYAVYTILKERTQDEYAFLRRYLIEHPLISQFEKRELVIRFMNADYINALMNEAYEEIPPEVFLCPNCGWTRSYIGNQPICSSRACINLPNADIPLDRKKYELRLKRGVMRYISNPGKLELEIQSFCEKLNIKNELWPNHDQYDIKIIFKDGTTWGIDAKDYANPYMLAKSISEDREFQRAPIDKGFYVVPNSATSHASDYLKVCKRALPNASKFDCIKLSQLKSLIRNKEVK